VREGRAGWTVRYREYLCPITGRRIDTELLREGDAPLHDVALAPAELPRRRPAPPWLRSVPDGPYG
jgi:hypothetical protein